MRLLPREIETFWTLFTGPAIWAGHFLICYASAAIFCAKPALFAMEFKSLRLGIAVITVLALAAIGLSAFLAWRQWGFGAHDPPHDDPTRHDRLLFQGFATLLLAGLSFVAVLMTALPTIFVSECLR
ncbi:hypothetical protein ACI2KT_25260 [Ensifer adhaerens]|jgi:hypothetical protein|uniref:Transmembrane protein n=1 Tax=Ensifer adhaerens TaxID=106592 RepID=A0ABY8HRM9_ENSAD|nr:MULTISPECIES: hypothetical protein [Ensifer]OWZ89366.1 hypothetical protein B9J07_33260 [Sinorhizobium sp. LM21]ANK77484.1 hypothetical protein FA04_33225 [Ensifer adhaerens]KDP72312.1 membrane protein [Ensifer adhaerens]KQX31539.1 hypothetical protein ASD01_18780 [Ensifer sp. Root423]KQX52282.1 hypothetical protein ASD49_30625 [Ensifer sp. Root1298]